MKVGQKKRKDSKTQKSGGFYLSLPIPSKEMGAIHPGWNQGDKLPDAEENPGSWYHQRLGGQARPPLPSRYNPIKQE